MSSSHIIQMRGERWLGFRLRGRIGFWSLVSDNVFVFDVGFDAGEGRVGIWYARGLDG